MMHTIMLGSLNTELNSSMTNPLIGRILSLNKKFCCTILDPSKLKTRWSGSYITQIVSPHGAIEISDPKSGNIFKVNGQRLKPFYTTESESHDILELGLCDPVYL